jgi:hypothetical protein
MLLLLLVRLLWGRGSQCRFVEVRRRIEVDLLGFLMICVVAIFGIH